MSFHCLKEMQYKGFKYEPMEDVEPDNIKIFHIVVTPEGKEIHMDWSPYSVPTIEDFQVWIDLGCPDRIGCGPLRREDLATLLKERKS